MNDERGRVPEAGFAHVLRLAERAELAARNEWTRRRYAWVGIAAVLVLVPVAFNLARAAEFRASVPVFPRDVGPYPGIHDPAVYRTFLDDPLLRREMARNAPGARIRYADVRIQPDPTVGALVITAPGPSPQDARRFVNALGPQIAEASARHLAALVRLDAAGVRSRLRDPGVPKGERRALRARLREIERLLPEPPHRAVVGRRAQDPPLRRWGDRLADAMPGPLPQRLGPVRAAVGGALIFAGVWLTVLILVAPRAATAAERRGGEPRLAHWLRRLPERYSARVPEPRTRPPSPPLPRWVALAGAGVLVASGGFVMWVGRGEIFLGDEWAFVLDRREWTLDAFLRPHNEHLMAVPVAVFKTLFVTTGADEYWPYRLAVTLAHVACLALVFVIARRRVGGLAAALLTAPILAFGPGWEVILYAINLGFLGSIVTGLGAMLALDRGSGRGDVAAGALLVVSLASSTLGACFALGAAVEVLWRRDAWRRVAFVIGPALLYGAWYLGYNLEPDRQGPLEVSQAPAFAFRAAAGALSALYGAPLGVETLGTGYHRGLELLAFAALLVALAVLVRRVLVTGVLSPRLLMIATTLVSFWLLTGAARAYSGQAYAGRYVYPAAVLILVLVTEAWHGSSLPRRWAWLAVPVALAIALANAGWLVKDGNGRRADAEVLAAELAALELVRPHVPPRLPIDDQRARFMTAGGYFAAVDALGSPALSLAELPQASPLARRAADALLVRAAIRVVPYEGSAGRSPMRVTIGGTAARFAWRRGGCLDVAPPGRRVVATFELPAGGVAVVPSGPRAATVRMRRFGPAHVDVSRPRDGGGAAYELAAPPDSSPVVWTVRVASDAPFRLC